MRPGTACDHNAVVYLHDAGGRSCVGLLSLYCQMHEWRWSDCRCDTRKAAVVDAGAVAPLLRTFAMGIPELAGELAAVCGESELAPPVPDEQRHLHGCAIISVVFSMCFN